MASDWPEWTGTRRSRMAIEQHRTLYTRDASGAVRFWRMERDGGAYRSVSGVLGGAEVRTGWTQAAPKNAGRANATTAEEQALSEVEAQYRQKLDRKYHESAEGVGGHKFFAPMLAQKYSGWGDARWSRPKQRVFAQPKLDGFRCIASAGGLTSRQGKPFHLPHIVEALGPLFAEEPDALLDGELYNHDLRDDFNTLGSLIKKGSRTAEEEARVRRTVQYHVYDGPTSGFDFAERRLDVRATLDLFLPGFGGPDFPVRWVETHEAMTEFELDGHYARFVEAGYEGMMVRLDLPYEPGKRSWSLLKRKDFLDGEFGLVRVEEGVGNWAGYAKTAVIRLPDGREQSSGLRGSQEFTRGLLEGWRRYSQVTVRYQNLTPDGLLRFPVVVDWHEGAREY